MIDLQTLTSLGPIPLLIAVCNMLGLVLKKSPLQDKWIPLLLTAVGAGLYPFITSESDANVRNPEVYNVLIGSVIGGSSVGLNQMIRQLVGGNGKETPKTNETTPPNPPVAG